MRTLEGGRPPNVPAVDRQRPIDRAWTAIAICVPAILALSTRIGTADLAYHIRAGHEIIRLRAIPRVDTFTFTVNGQPWFDQQWGAQLVLAITETVGGWHALALGRAALVSITFSVVFLACRARGARPAIAAGLALAGFLVAAVNLSMRPQMLVLPLFAASLLVWANRRRHPGWMWIIPVLAAASANLHGSFVLFPILPALAWLADREDRVRARRWLILTATTIAATLATPFGPKVWLYATDLSTSPLIRRTIEEWQPAAIATPTGALFFGSVLAVAALLARRRAPASLVELVALAVFLLPALAAVRGLLWWGVVAPVIFAGLIPQRAPSREHPDEGKAPAIVTIACLVLATSVLAVTLAARDQRDLLRDAPVGMTQAIDELPSGTRLLVHQPWSSWIIYAVPDVPVFADSRIELFPDAIWRDYSEVAFGGFRWQEVLERHRIEAIAAPSDWVLIPVIREQPGWTTSYEGEEGALFVRLP